MDQLPVTVITEVSSGSLSVAASNRSVLASRQMKVKLPEVEIQTLYGYLIEWKGFWDQLDCSKYRGGATKS